MGNFSSFRRFSPYLSYYLLSYLLHGMNTSRHFQIKNLWQNQFWTLQTVHADTSFVQTDHNSETVNCRFGHSRTFSQLGFPLHSPNFLFCFFLLQKLSMKFMKTGSLVSSIHYWPGNSAFMIFLVLALLPPPLSMKTKPSDRSSRTVLFSPHGLVWMLTPRSATYLYQFAKGAMLQVPTRCQ